MQFTGVKICSFFRKIMFDGWKGISKTGHPQPPALPIWFYLIYNLKPPHSGTLDKIRVLGTSGRLRNFSLCAAATPRPRAFPSRKNVGWTLNVSWSFSATLLCWLMTPFSLVWCFPNKMIHWSRCFSQLVCCLALLPLRLQWPFPHHPC